MRKHHPFTRRRFIGSLPAIAASIQIVPRHVLGGQGTLSPNEIPTKAVVGVGGMGRGHLKNVNSAAKLVAVCDVDKGHLKTALEQSGPDVQGYTDFREVIARKDVDIVHIPTPPHWHALISIAAAEAGKDIWCEKPMTRTIWEGEKVVEAVQRNKRIFRLNTWFRFEGGFYGMGTPVQPIKKLVNSGLLGWPLKVTLNQSTGFNWKHNWSGRTDLTPQPVPEQLDELRRHLHAVLRRLERDLREGGGRVGLAGLGALAQLAGELRDGAPLGERGAVLLLHDMDDRDEKLVFFTGIDKARFRRTVVPGDQLRLTVEVLKFRPRTAKLRAIAEVDGQKAAEADIMSALVNRSKD